MKSKESLTFRTKVFDDNVTENGDYFEPESLRKAVLLFSKKKDKPLRFGINGPRIGDVLDATVDMQGNIFITAAIKMDMVSKLSRLGVMFDGHTTDVSMGSKIKGEKRSPRRGQRKKKV